jgi:hypothetical protein
MTKFIGEFELLGHNFSTTEKTILYTCSKCNLKCTIDYINNDLFYHKTKYSLPSVLDITCNEIIIKQLLE